MPSSKKAQRKTSIRSLKIWSPHTLSPNRKNGRGKRRRKPLRSKTYGWTHRPRTKVSPMAARGWNYEVVFNYDIFWDVYTQGGDPNVFMADIARQMKCRFVGHEGYAQRAHIRLYVPSMDEIVQLRLLLAAEYIFRIYRLVERPPTAVNESSPSPGDPSAQS